MIYHLGRAIDKAIGGRVEPKLISLAEDYEAHKLNQSDTLPPVGCNLAIIIGGRPVTAKRTGYIASRGDMLEYELLDGSLIGGRFEWRYL
ncbi:MAG: hypothetical protein KTR16_12670 [Acidiferrobacterales bacterium]|nr:hypothetical protein [Acidiferrobacterales bacterium]